MRLIKNIITRESWDFMNFPLYTNMPTRAGCQKTIDQKGTPYLLEWGNGVD
jgi:hypothetical protein